MQLPLQCSCDGENSLWPVNITAAQRVPQTFMLLNLNAVMSIISNVPAAIVSTVSCFALVPYSSLTWHLLPDRCMSYCPTAQQLYLLRSWDVPVRHVTEWILSFSLTHTRSSTQGSTLAFRSHISGVRPKISTKGAPKEGVHVQVRPSSSFTDIILF